MNIAALYVYPVKSCAGVALTRATLSPQGFAGDRQWMLIKPDGNFLSQRQHPRMALIRAAPLGDGLRLSAPGMPDMRVTAVDDTAPVGVKIWRDSCLALCAAPAVNRWVSEFLQSRQPLRLVKFHPDTSRRPYQPERFGKQQAKFADAAPYLVTNRASLDALNTRLRQLSLPAVSMARFRPNIVVAGLEAFAEHRLQTLDVGAVHLKMVDPCSRCAIITLDPDSGEQSPGRVPFPQLAELNPMPGQAKLPAFGVNACFAENFATNGVLKVGQSIACR